MSLKTFSSRVLFRVLNHGVVASSKPLRSPHAAAAAAAAVVEWRSVRGYHNIKKPMNQGPGRAARIRVVDLRSDVMARPGSAMRQAMVKAVLEDDPMKREETVHG